MEEPVAIGCLFLEVVVLEVVVLEVVAEEDVEMHINLEEAAQMVEVEMEEYGEVEAVD